MNRVIGHLRYFESGKNKERKQDTRCNPMIVRPQWCNG